MPTLLWFFFGLGAGSTATFFLSERAENSAKWLVWGIGAVIAYRMLRKKGVL